MDALGQRIIDDKARISVLQQQACALRLKADKMDAEADEIARLLELARRELPKPRGPIEADYDRLRDLDRRDEADRLYRSLKQS